MPQVGMGEADTENDDEPSSAVPAEESGEAATRMLAETVANPLFYLVGGLVAIKLVASLGEQVGAIVLLSAAPVVGLTLISKSDAGKKVQEGLEARLPALQADAHALAARQLSAREQR
jgi:light-harvesting complex II chlorophyll a/b binding protein 7